MTDQLVNSLMGAVFGLMSLTDQSPKTGAKGVPPTEVDSRGPLNLVLDNPSNLPEPPHLEATSTSQEIVCRDSQHAHLALQTVSEKYERLKGRHNNISQERDYLQVRVNSMENTVSQHVDHFHRFQSTINALQDQLAATRAELAQARQDLQASRSFFSTETYDDGKTLVDMLSVLNQKIDEFAYVVCDLVPQHMGEAHFTPPETEKGLADMRSLETLGSFATQTNLSIADVLQYGIQHLTCEHLLSILFMQFAPRIDESLSHYLNKLHQSVSLQYPQAHGARWRAMTYSHVRPRDIGWSARWWVERILAFVSLCAPGCPPATDELAMRALEKANEIYGAALALQDKARIAYLAYDYEIFAVDLGSRFKERVMSYGGGDRKKHKGRGEVLAVLGLGLKAWRSVCGDEGQYVREEVIPVRVSVLTAV